VFERFTADARQVVVLAHEEARTLMHTYIGTKHMLLGLLREDEDVAVLVLEGLDIPLGGPGAVRPDRWVRQTPSRAGAASCGWSIATGRPSHGAGGRSHPPMSDHSRRFEAAAIQRASLALYAGYRCCRPLSGSSRQRIRLLSLGN
jgi:hypothetical protein